CREIACVGGVGHRRHGERERVEPDAMHRPLARRAAGVAHQELACGDLHEVHEDIMRPMNVAERMGRLGTESAFEVLARSGALEGHGDEVIYPNPGFPIYESVINFVGATPVPIPLREASEFGFDLDVFEKSLSPRTKLIIINSPANPTGGVLDRAQIDRIAALAAARNIPVLSDDIYRQFLYEGEFVSIYNRPGMAERPIILDGFSKSYAMTGWRLGYGV